MRWLHFPVAVVARVAIVALVALLLPSPVTETWTPRVRWDRLELPLAENIIKIKVEFFSLCAVNTCHQRLDRKTASELDDMRMPCIYEPHTVDLSGI